MPHQSHSDGAGQRMLNTEPVAPHIERPAWSPLGDEIAATSYGSGKQEIWSLDLERGWKAAQLAAEIHHDVRKWRASDLIKATA